MPINSSIIGTEWLNVNALRCFPIRDDSDCTDISGGFKLPNDFLVDLSIPVSSAAQYDPDGFYISEVAIFGQGVVITFSYYNDGNSPASLPAGKIDIGSVSVSASSHTQNRTYYIHGNDPFADTLGRVTIGTLDTILKSGGTFLFNLANTRLVSTTIRSDATGVSSLRVINGTDVSDAIYGDIELVAGNNVSFSVSGNTITINAIEGAGLTASCGCASTSDVSLPPPIRTINGLPPNSNGNININATECVRIDSVQGGLSITDDCSTPCCTSEEINKIVTDQTQLNVDLRTQVITQQQLETQLIQLNALTEAIKATGLILS